MSSILAICHGGGGGIAAVDAKVREEGSRDGKEGGCLEISGAVVLEVEVSIRGLLAFGSSL